MKKDRMAKKKSYRWLACMAIIFLVAESNPTVLAAENEMGAEGIISDYTGPGEGSASTDNGTALTEGQIQLKDNVIYDSTNDTFIYLADNGRVTAGVYDGMIVTNPVYLAFGNGFQGVLYRDGEQVSTEVSTFSDAGEYVVQYRNNSGTSEKLLSFTIVSKLTGLIDHYELPAGFQTTSFTFNGEEQQPTSSISMEEEGSYDIQYECGKTGKIYELSVEIDHTPPQLKLEGVNNGIARGPVDISDLEQGAVIGITLDGAKYAYRKTLSVSGDYEIVVKDEAGNTTRYSFTIYPYLDLNAYLFMGAVLLLGIGVCVYMWFERKKLKIR